jgi:hypothetical protein
VIHSSRAFVSAQNALAIDTSQKGDQGDRPSPSLGIVSSVLTTALGRAIASGASAIAFNVKKRF